MKVEGKKSMRDLLDFTIVFFFLSFFLRIGEDPCGIPNNLMPFMTQVAIGNIPFVNIYGNDYNTVDGTGVRYSLISLMLFSCIEYNMKGLYSRGRPCKRTYCGIEAKLLYLF
jgi:hypothetical protein